jgi:Holliday junction resolvasome RuvABC DNA-binding subunit
LELRSKVEAIEGEDKQEVEASQEVIEALMAMGYSAGEARESVKAIPDDVTDESEMIKLALRSIKK